MKSVPKTLLLFTSFILVLMAYVPDIFENPGLYATFRSVSNILFVSLFILTIINRPIAYRTVIYVYFVILCLFALESLVLMNLGLITNLDPLTEIAIPFIMILIGYNINIPERKYLVFLIVYCIITTFVSIYSIYFYIGDFAILDHYMIHQKNSLGAILSNSLAIILCLIFLKNVNTRRKIPIILWAIIMLACLLIIRARSAFVAVVFCSLVLIWLSLRTRVSLKIIVGAISLGIVILYLYGELKFPQFLSEFFLGAEDLSDLNSVSSGRIERNQAAINFISDYPLFGQLKTDHYLEWVHNYVLLVVSRYGIIGSFLLLILYFYLSFVIVINILKIKELGLEHIGYFVLIIPFFISLLEPTFPYGPGSVQVIAFFMFGYALKNSFYPKTP